MSLFIILSAFSIEGSVLCFGKDGHVAIEFVDACNGSVFGSKVVGTENDACGPCKDVRFLDSPAFTHNTFHCARTPSVVSSVPTYPSLPSEEYSDNCIILPERSHFKTLTGLQSVVLLI
jgi:hypothetical protein